MYIKKISFYLIFLFPLFLNAQNNGQYEIGLPFVRNYYPKEYKAYSQNWGCVQDNRDVLYFANGDGVLEYDGTHWTLIKITNGYTVTALAIDANNRIYVGSASEFGYLSPNKNGKLEYVSLMNKIDQKYRKFDYITRIYTIKSEVYFSADNYLFKWSNNKMKTWDLHSPCKFLRFADKIIIYQQNKGISILQNDKIIKLNTWNFFSDKNIQDIHFYRDNKLLVVTYDSGMFLVTNPFGLKPGIPVIRKFYNELDFFLKYNVILSSIRLSNWYYAFSTMRGGTAIMDENGFLVKILDKKAGVQNETHTNIFQDIQDALWISSDNGITRVDFSSPISYWNDDMDLRGSVLSVTRFKGRIYAGTWQGLYYHRLFSQKYLITEDEVTSVMGNFTLLRGIKAQTWDLLVIENEKNPAKSKLLAATSSGIYEIDTGKCIKISNAATFKLLRSKNDPSKIFAGTDEGLLSLSISYNKDKIVFGNEWKLNDFKEKVNSIEEDNKHRIWISTEFSGVFMLEFNNEINHKNSISKVNKCQYELTHFDTSSGLPSTAIKIFKYQNRLIFVSENGIYLPVINHNKNKLFYSFKRENISSNYLAEESFFINMMTEDSKGNLWIQLTNKYIGKKIILKGTRNNNGSYIYISYPFKTIPQMEISSIYPEKNITWFGGDDGLFRYDSKTKYSYKQPFNALIHKVTLERDSIIFYGIYYKDISDSGELTGLSLIQPEQMKHKISYSYNSISFEYSASSFIDESSKQYKVFLEGFDKKWSEWNNETKKAYTNLPPGKYTFHVISKNIFGTESNDATYEFRILAPWYRTIFAYIIYIFGFAFIIYSALKYSNKRLRKAKLNLEEIVKQRTNEINQQKNEFEKEKEKSDKLLLNVLPFKIAEELKTNGTAKTKFFEQVTVLFSDFKDFTIIAQQLDPQDLIAELNRCFMFFDDVCVRHNIEKIKTVGDSYMCAGGVPIKNKTNPIDVILAAFEIRDYISRLKKEQAGKGKTLWKIRIGVHTGQIISGVVGKKKFAYDIWGDTVNTASRLEQASLPNKINISGTTYEAIKDFFDCTYRGKIPVKHKGVIDMYFADRIKKDLSVDDNGRIPNQQFWEKYELYKTQNSKFEN